MQLERGRAPGPAHHGSDMNETAQVSRLIGEIYDASLDPSLWQRVLQAIASFIPVSAVNLFAQDAMKKNANVFYVHGLDPAFIQSYFDKYIKLNPLFPATLFFDVGRIVTEDDVLPRAQWLSTRFFKEWVEPQGYIDSLATVLEKSAMSVAMLSVLRHRRDGMVDDRARRNMALVVPHVRRALLIGKVIDLHKIDAAAFADALDGLAAGMFLVDGAGRIVHANVSGHALLAKGDVVRTSGLQLSAVEPRAQQALQDALAAAESGDGTIGGKGIGIALAGPERVPHVAHVLPLTAGARREAGARHSAVAAVFVHQATLEGSTPFETIAQHFRLTPAELRVLLAIVEIGGVPEVAPVLGLAETTVKTHLQHVFEKTGTQRQADLVKLVAGFLSPLAEPPR
jgi:DNA-binding CsgD family transcriptional regulator